MPGKILLSTAYLPPAEYFFRILNADEVIIEREENYIKQTYRNRCYILSSNGPHLLTLPVYLGSFHKTPIKDIRIDYSKRWQQVHLRALEASYRSSPFFIFYYESLEKIILNKYEFLIDLNTDLLLAILNILKISTKLKLSSEFTPPCKSETDFRYSIIPKIPSFYSPKQYLQVFNPEGSFTKGLSIADMIFNIGPESGDYL